MKGYTPSISMFLRLLLTLLTVTLGFAAKPVPLPLIPPGSAIYVAPMTGDLAGFISAEIIKQKLPLVVVMTEVDASYILAGASLQGDNKWFNSIWGGKDKHEGNVQLFDAKKKVLIWAGEAGDRSLFATAYKRGGLRKVADRIVKQMKNDVFKK